MPAITLHNLLAVLVLAGGAALGWAAVAWAFGLLKVADKAIVIVLIIAAAILLVAGVV